MASGKQSYATSLPAKPLSGAAPGASTSASPAGTPTTAAGVGTSQYANGQYAGAQGYQYGTQGYAGAGPSASYGSYGYVGAGAGPSSGQYGAGTYDAYGASYGYGAYGQDGYAYGSAYGSAYDDGAQGTFTTDEELAAQQSAYNPDNMAAQTATVKAPKGQPRTTVLRKGAGEVWEDQTLLEWDPSHFRLFIGDLGNDVNEDDLVAAFGPAKGWSSFVKAKVVRDKVTNKTRGYGFVSYSDPEDFMKAWKAMNGKYVGSRPVKISKATTKVGKVDIGAKKAKELETKKKAHTVGNKVRGAVAQSGTWKPYIRR